MNEDALLKPVIVWFRKDLRLSDNPALYTAAAMGRPILPVFIVDPIIDGMGAAAKWRLELSLRNLQDMLGRLGTKLVIRKGPALQLLRQLITQTGADVLHYGRDYTPEAIARDTEIKTELEADGVSVTSHKSLVLFEPWTVKTQTGGYYRVYSPMWRAVRDVSVGEVLPAPEHLPVIPDWPGSLTLTELNLGKHMDRGGNVVAQYTTVGETAALAKLSTFIDDRVDRYKTDRDFLDHDAASGLSENLAYGEISARQMWVAGQTAMAKGAHGAEHFLKEITWREFAYHLMFHTPHILDENWRDGWGGFPWRSDDHEMIAAWKYGYTGIPVIDAAMRELYVTGRMHNRARMIVASYLTKHMLIDWRVGRDWFAQTLIDWDPASNALGWQWVAGCGPDAAPFFRIFNPILQGEKFDPKGVYRDRFLGSGTEAQSFFDAVPRSLDLPRNLPGSPVVDLATGRARALEAYSQIKK